MKLDWKRIGRAALCLLVICCMVINVSPIRANAVAGTIVAGTAAAGYAATLFSMAMGVVFVDLTSQLIDSLGISMTDFLYEKAGDDTEIVDVWIQPLQINLTGSGGGSDDDGDIFPILGDIPDQIMEWIKEWVSTLINGASITTEQTAPSGFVYYNDVLLPVIPTPSDPAFQYKLIFNKNDAYYVWFLDEFLDIDYSDNVTINNNVAVGYHIKYELIDNVWSGHGGSAGCGIGYEICTMDQIIWSSHNLVRKGTSTVVFEGSESDTSTITQQVPGVFVGDIPAGIQDGTLSEEDVTIGDINYGSVLNYSGLTGIDALNAVAQDLANGTLSYEEYMELTQVSSPIMSITVSYDDTKTVAPGSQIQCSASIYATGNEAYDSYVVWTISGQNSANTSIDSKGMLTVGTDETTQWINVFATSVEAPSVFGSVSIKLDQSGSTEETEPVIGPDYSGQFDNMNQNLTDVKDAIGNLPDQITDSMNDLMNQQQTDGEIIGSDAAQDVLDIVPNDSAAFLDALGDLVSVLSYEGTSAVITMPAIKVPGLGGLFPELLIHEEEDVDLEYYFTLMPAQLLTLIRVLFDIAVVGYCVKELLELIHSALTGFGGGLTNTLVELEE